MKVEIATDIVVDLEDRPHALAAFTETMARAGVEIEGFCGLYAAGAGIDHILLNDLDLARPALSAAKVRIVVEREVLVLDGGAETGEFARIARRLADADVRGQPGRLDACEPIAHSDEEPQKQQPRGEAHEHGDVEPSLGARVGIEVD